MYFRLLGFPLLGCPLLGRPLLGRPLLGRPLLGRRISSWETRPKGGYSQLVYIYMYIPRNFSFKVVDVKSCINVSGGDLNPHTCE